jgi:hypothetical protein
VCAFPITEALMFSSRARRPLPDRRRMVSRRCRFASNSRHFLPMAMAVSAWKGKGKGMGKKVRNWKRV